MWFGGFNSSNTIEALGVDISKKPEIKFYHTSFEGRFIRIYHACSEIKILTYSTKETQDQNLAGTIKEIEEHEHIYNLHSLEIKDDQLI